MKLRRREAVWLLALGGLLLTVRGMDSRTASLRRSAQASAAQAAAAGAPVTAPAPGLAVAPDAADEGARISTADLAALAWGPNPFHGGAARRDAAASAGSVTVEGPAAAAAPDAPRLPRFQGLVRAQGRLLAAIDGKFLAPGGRSGDWQLQEIGADGVTVRQVRTGEVRRLSRERTVSAR